MFLDSSRTYNKLLLFKCIPVLNIFVRSEIMKKVERLGHTYGLPMRFWLGNRFVILYNRPEHLEVILNSPQTLDKGNVYEFITKVMGGEGLFTSSGE